MINKSWQIWLAKNLAMGADERVLIKSASIKTGTPKENVERHLYEIQKNVLFEALSQIAAELKGFHALHETLNSLNAQRPSTGLIERVKKATPEDFHRDYYSKNRPVIIENTISHWPALEKWNFDYFDKEFGSEEVAYQNRRRSKDILKCFENQVEKSTMSRFISRCKNSRDGEVYLIAHDRLLERTAFQRLFDDMPLTDYIYDKKSRLGRTFLWIGPQGGHTPLHRDLANVYLIQIKGRKLVKMLPPFFTHKLKADSGYFSKTLASELFNIESAKENFIQEIIHPGEMLFIPVGWWHDIIALDPVISITGNNFVYPNTFPNTF